jgi:hypothetical protein
MCGPVKNSNFRLIYLKECFFNFRRLRNTTRAVGAHADRSACHNTPPPPFSSWGETVHLVLRPLFRLLYQFQVINEEYCEAVGGMRIGGGHWSTWRKPAPVPLCPPQFPRELTWAWTRPTVVGSRRLTAWAMARLNIPFNRKQCANGLFVGRREHL